MDTDRHEPVDVPGPAPTCRVQVLRRGRDGDLASVPFATASSMGEDVAAWYASRSRMFSRAATSTGTSA
ncbi:hypothetical protein ACLB9X_28085 [Streptomyces sp. 5K101]|uniref:hypothetical protein n=1 Tax=Streptomyces sp. 5K101 TaxID=3390037 RepID=UPI0039771A49